MMKDRGTLFKTTFRVMPGNNGTFVIREGDFYNSHTSEGTLPSLYGFTSVDDLLKFLTDEAEAMKSSGAAGSAFTVDAKGNRLHD